MHSISNLFYFGTTPCMFRTVTPPETCRVFFQNKINLRYCASSWFYYRNILRCMVLQTSNLAIHAVTNYARQKCRYINLIWCTHLQVYNYYITVTHIALYHMYYQAINYQVNFVFMPLFTLILKVHLTTKYEIIYHTLKWKDQITALFEVHS
jgi:hypothetical protein